MGVLEVFIVLKLIGVITWSWWWVLSPLWGVVVIILFASIMLYTGAFCAENIKVVNKIFFNKENKK